MRWIETPPTGQVPAAHSSDPTPAERFERMALFYAECHMGKGQLNRMLERAEPKDARPDTVESGFGPRIRAYSASLVASWRRVVDKALGGLPSRGWVLVELPTETKANVRKNK
ncbi:MAG: hypothetical protein VKO21_12615 [Candidatus Sericytochromatia bacterium]|nr:hypothetical protein [Candidatus Sericytochromatia bacterium]